MNTPIHSFIKEYAYSEYTRCHTPGHKGVSEQVLYRHDITEINDRSIEIIRESERNAAGLFLKPKAGKTGRTLFSCSGSTLAISAMLTSVISTSKTNTPRITAARNTHRSFVDSAILLGFEVDWVHNGENVMDCINGDTVAIFLTNIDYYGNIATLPDAKVLEALNIPLVVDNAHGAYLVFTDAHPINLGAAMSADSAHKTLPALTGAAYLHIAANYEDRFYNPAFDAFSLWGTSSPSYLILESLDLCNLHIANEKERAYKSFELVSTLKEHLIEIGYTLYKSDLLRITIDTNAYGYIGSDFAKALVKLGVMCEMHDQRYIILMFSTITAEEDTNRVFNALKQINKRKAIIPLFPPPNSIDLKTIKILPMRAAYFSKKRRIDISNASGEVCAGVQVTIPPCTPIIVPGEVITKDIIEFLKLSGIEKIDIID